MSLIIRPATAFADAICAAHPCVFMTPADVKDLKLTIENWDKAKQYFENLKLMTDAYRARELEIPALGGIYTQRYICPIHGKYLRFNLDQPHKHFCDICGKYYESAELDGCWREYKHMMNIEYALNAALVYQLTGYTEYAAWARKVLVSYAEKYKQYPPHGGPAGLGRLTSQSLDEAVLLINAAAAFDLIADSPVMSDTDRELIPRKLLVPAARHVEGYPFGIHNIQVWHSTAMLVSGLLAGNSELSDRAAATLREEIENGITPDGLWDETSVGYHLYAMKPFSVLSAVCRNQKLDVCANPKFRKIFTVLQELTMPNNFNLPAINDYRHNVNLAEMLPGAIAARYAFEDKSFDTLIQTLLGSDLNNWGFIYLRKPETDQNQTRWKPPAKSSHLPGSGLTVLRRDGMYALTKYNPTIGGHDHNDRLEVLFENGDSELYPDLGTVPYGHPLYRAYYRRTEAHNTLMVDRQQQNPSACEPLHFYYETDFTGVTVECKEIYKGATIRRTLVLAGRALIDVTVADSTANHIYDWFLHVNYKEDAVNPFAQNASKLDSISPNPEIVLKELSQLENGDSIQFQPAADTATGPSIAFYSSNPITLYKGYATGFRPDETMPVMMWRQEGKSAVFAAVTRHRGSDIKSSSIKGNEFIVDMNGGKEISISLIDGNIIEK